MHPKGNQTFWFSFVLKPLQKLYLPSYMTLPMTGRTTQTVPVWWIWKTGPKRKPELATDADVVSVKVSKRLGSCRSLSPRRLRRTDGPDSCGLGRWASPGTKQPHSKRDFRWREPRSHDDYAALRRCSFLPSVSDVEG